MAPAITDVETVQFTYERDDIGTMESGFNFVYDPGNTVEYQVYALRIHTDEDITGEYVSWGGTPSLAQVKMCAEYLIGRNPLNRERHWSELKRALRKYDKMGLGPIDIALWDFAGKYYDAPVCNLLGAYRTDLPTYASTFFGDNNGGLETAEDFADFAGECLELGYPGYKMHAWGGSDENRDPQRVIDAVHAVGERVGDEMDLMLDPACEYETWGDALKIGRACDEEEFFWYEDPYRDGGYSIHAHRKLSEELETPLLQGEHVRSLENRTDLMAEGGTEFIRTDPEYDGGITGAIKTARAAEGLGLDVELHGTGPAHRHAMAAMRNSNYYENAIVHPETDHLAPNEVYVGDYTEALETVSPDGTFPVPHGPGLGVEYDWDYIADHQVASDDEGFWRP